MHPPTETIWRRALAPGGVAFGICAGALIWHAISQADAEANVVLDLIESFAWGLIVGVPVYLSAVAWFHCEQTVETPARSTPLPAVVSHDGWIQCPGCGFSFSIGDLRALHLGRHVSCGQALKLVREPETPGSAAPLRR